MDDLNPLAVKYFQEVMRSGVLHERRTGVEGERNFCAAIMVRAISDLFIERPCWQKATARVWINSSDWEAPSFLWCCDALDLDSEILKQQLKGMARPNYIRGYVVDYLE